MTSHKRTRAPRFRVPNNEQAVVSIEADRFTGTLGLLSRTGGTIRLPKRFPEGTFADIGIWTISGRFQATIQLLRAVNGNAQAFRFIQMGATARGRLEDALRKMRAQGFGVKAPNALDDFVDFARRLITLGSTK